MELDIDKLQRSIKACAHHPEHDCKNCKYSDDKLWCYNDEMLEDFDKCIELLRAKTVIDIQLSKDGFIFGGCPNCKSLITHADHKNNCGYCGQAVKWSE